MSLYAKGHTTGEIREHLEEIHATSTSEDSIGRMADASAVDIAAWQSRPLDAMYLVILVDAIVIKVRNTQVGSRALYETCSGYGSGPPVARVRSGG